MKTNTKIFSVTILIIFSAVGGSLVGFFNGQLLKNFYLTEGAKWIYLFAEPGYEFLYVRAMVNSNDENERLSSYYAIKEYGWGNAAFFIDRFKKEQSLHVKRVLVWLMRFSNDADAVLEICAKYYKISEKPIQKTMRETLLHMGISEKVLSERLKD